MISRPLDPRAPGRGVLQNCRSAGWSGSRRIVSPTGSRPGVRIQNNPTPIQSAAGLNRHVHLRRLPTCGTADYQSALRVFATILLTGIASVCAQNSGTNSSDDAADLAKKLSNPVAALISVPFQSNFEFGGGPNNDGFRYLLNFQPVIPISLNKEWNLISRTILPIISQHDIIGTTSQSGLGDITQSLFFSPKEPGKGGWIWGAGPVFLFPSATNDLLGTEKFGLGPTAVLLKQEHGWTYGILVNQIWSVAGDDDRDNVNATFFQPFLSYTTKKQTTFTLNTESSYDWTHSQLTAPINLAVAQLVKIGKVPVQFQLGGKVYAEGPSGNPEAGIRFAVTLLFPK